MITTRFGSEIEVRQSADEDGYVEVVRVEDGAERIWHSSELRWDTDEEAILIFGTASGKA